MYHLIDPQFLLVPLGIIVGLALISEIILNTFFWRNWTIGKFRRSIFELALRVVLFYVSVFDLVASIFFIITAYDYLKETGNQIYFYCALAILCAPFLVLQSFAFFFAFTQGSEYGLKGGWDAVFVLCSFFSNNPMEGFRIVSMFQRNIANKKVVTKGTGIANRDSKLNMLGAGESDFEMGRDRSFTEKTSASDASRRSKAMNDFRKTEELSRKVYRGKLEKMFSRFLFLWSIKTFFQSIPQIAVQGSFQAIISEPNIIVLLSLIGSITAFVFANTFFLFTEIKPWYERRSRERIEIEIMKQREHEKLDYDKQSPKDSPKY